MHSDGDRKARRFGGRRRPQTGGACECEAECREDDVMVQQGTVEEELELATADMVDTAATATTTMLKGVPQSKVRRRTSRRTGCGCSLRSSK